MAAKKTAKAPETLTIQLRRHLEIVNRITHEHTASVIQTLRDENDSLRRQIKDDRTEQSERLRNRDRAMESMLQSLMPMLPVVISRFSGPSNDSGVPHTVAQQAVFDVAIFKSFLATITEEEFNVLIGTFGGRLAGIIDLAARYKREYEEAQGFKSDTKKDPTAH